MKSTRLASVKNGVSADVIPPFSITTSGVDRKLRKEIYPELFG